MKNIPIFIVISLMLAACGLSPASDNDGTSGTEAEKEKTMVVTTLFPYAEFARGVVGQQAEVYLLLKPGVEPHNYDPSPQDIKRIMAADLFVYTGAEMEPWAADIIEANSDINALSLLDAKEIVKISGEKDSHEDETDHESDAMVEPQVDDHDGIDPHIWLSFENDMVAVDLIVAELSKLDSENKSYYQTNAKEFIERLTDLHEQYQAGLADCREDILVSGGHNVFGYLADEYDFEVVTAYGLAPQSEPTPREMADLLDLAEEYQIDFVVFESLASPKVADTIAEAVGAETLSFNPAANLTPKEAETDPSFIEIMYANLTTLETALDCSL